jgi:hypothetical protein
MAHARQIQPQKAIYYPHVEFASTAWVKSALLYWESVVRWRPPGSAPQDDPEIEQLLAARLIEELSPEPDARHAAPEIGQRIEELIGALGGELPACLPGIRGLRGMAPEREERDRAEILEAMEGYPLAKKAFVERSDQARALFLTLWAEKVAHERRFAAVTDEPVVDAIALYLEHDQVTDDARRLTPGRGQAIAELSLPTPSLEAIAQLSVERLLEIRQKYAHQRRHFRETVQARVAAIAELETPQAIEEKLKALEAETRDDLEAAREAVKDANVRERWSLLGVTAPASLAAAMSIAAYSPVLGPAGGVGAIALGVTSWFMQKRAGSPPPVTHYLLSVDAAVTTSPWQRVASALRDIRGGERAA